MSWLTTLATFFGALNPYVAIFSGALGIFATYFINQWIQYQQAKKQASDQMDQDISAHASDGQVSVSDMDSAQSQIQNLTAQAEQLDKGTQSATKTDAVQKT